MGDRSDREFAAWQRVTLPLLLLGEMEIAPGHGYGLAERLVQRGLNPVKGAALYPVLNRLEDDGLATSTWEPGESGPGRKVYHLSPAGAEQLAESRSRFTEFAAIIVDGYGQPTAP